jgi:rSAM/selenodomain-associated transferase 2
MISVIIPAFNEEASLPVTVHSVRQEQADREIILVDGGSTDQTVQTARELGLATYKAPLRQRAGQMNFGAAQARGEVLLFLHADTSLPPRALQRVLCALEDQTVGGGAFVRKFDSASPLLKVTCLLAEIRNRAIGWHLGDQAMFVRKAIFQTLNGFAPRNRFEDLDFSRRLAGVSRIVTLRPPVISSARRFARDGTLVRTLRDFWLTLGYLRENHLDDHR